jgi:hypothetical protein
MRGASSWTLAGGEAEQLTISISTDGGEWLA